MSEHEATKQQKQIKKTSRKLRQYTGSWFKSERDEVMVPLGVTKPV